VRPSDHCVVVDHLSILIRATVHTFSTPTCSCRVQCSVVNLEGYTSGLLFLKKDDDDDILLVALGLDFEVFSAVPLGPPKIKNRSKNGPNVNSWDHWRVDHLEMATNKHDHLTVAY
jgi:hypothetical protein